MNKIFPAATVVLARDGAKGIEVLLLKRSEQVSFAEGLWVFPGGRIDKMDYGDDLDDIEAAACRGAVRETREETQLHIDGSALVYFAHWTTPPHSPRRYATWFFVADSNGVATDPVLVDGSEIVDYRWYRPADALADHRGKIIDMMPPTFVTLNELLAFGAVDQALDAYRNRPVPEYAPRFVTTDRGVAMLYAGDAGYNLSDADVAGSRHRCWMLEEAWRYEKHS